jgi:hypothetical protein
MSLLAGGRSGQVRSGQVRSGRGKRVDRTVAGDCDCEGSTTFLELDAGPVDIGHPLPCTTLYPLTPRSSESPGTQLRSRRSELHDLMPLSRSPT